MLKQIGHRIRNQHDQENKMLPYGSEDEERGCGPRNARNVLESGEGKELGSPLRLQRDHGPVDVLISTQ